MTPHKRLLQMLRPFFNPLQESDPYFFLFLAPANPSTLPLAVPNIYQTKGEIGPDSIPYSLKSTASTAFSATSTALKELPASVCDLLAFPPPLLYHTSHSCCLCEDFPSRAQAPCLRLPQHSVAPDLS